jgi:hypothetical protein
VAEGPKPVERTLDVGFLLRWPSECSMTTTRNGEQEPCGKPAVSATLDPEDDSRPYPTCAAHTFIGRAVPLSDLIRAIQEAHRA